MPHGTVCVIWLWHLTNKFRVLGSDMPCIILLSFKLFTSLVLTLMLLLVPLSIHVSKTRYCESWKNTEIYHFFLNGSVSAALHLKTTVFVKELFQELPVLYALLIYYSVLVSVYASKWQNLINFRYSMHDTVVKVCQPHKTAEKFRRTKQFHFEVILMSNVLVPCNDSKFKSSFCWIHWHIFKDCQMSSIEVMVSWTRKHVSKNWFAPWSISAVAK